MSYYCLWMMVDSSVEALSLLPSQLIGRQVLSTRNREHSTNTPSFSANIHISSNLIPSQVIHSSALGLSLSTEPAVEEPTKAAAAAAAAPPRRQGRRRPKKKTKKKEISKPIQPKDHFPLEGNYPDIHWRSVPLEHLRLHPRVVPLPKTVQKLDTIEDVRNFRQESWQWDALHRGRCTTSQAVAALGFLEPSTGAALGVPLAWRRGGGGAFARLREPALRTLQEMNTVLCDGEKIEQETVLPMSPWCTSTNSSFAAEYNYQHSEQETSTRMKLARKLGSDENVARGIRMMWGNTQESTALLTALNYFSKIDPGLELKEIGMCGAGLDLNMTSAQSSLLIGATPDGILCYSDGTIEALEVKNHCPFFAVRVPRKKGRKISKRFFLGDREFDSTGKSDGVFAHYVSQLQLEMLCLGPACRSAVMVRQTATKGALILRMRRDDEWISEMLYWLHKFHSKYVEKGIVPPTDFFWENKEDAEEQSRYRDFIVSTPWYFSMCMLPTSRKLTHDSLFLAQNSRASRFNGRKSCSSAQ